MNWNKDKALEMAYTRKIGYSGNTLCDNYRNPLERCDTAAQAIRLLKNSIGWALLERYPTKEEMLSFADKEVLAANGVYIDTTFDGERIDDHVCVVFINCKGHISTGLNFAKRIIPKFYLSEGSDLVLDIDENLVFPIDAELYYGSEIREDEHSVSKNRGSKLSVRDYNAQTARDNVGFTEEELNTNPNLELADL